jgi:nucleoside triphosphate diphosphatase
MIVGFVRGVSHWSVEMTSNDPSNSGPSSEAQLAETAAPAKPYTLKTLLEIMAALRDPETGCPWDIKQTFETIAPYTVEEAYEVGDAIDRGDLADIRDELGDLLLQVAYHSRIAEELGAFSFDDVASAICEKMVRRHPHVFGTEDQRSNGVAPGFWERIKKEERAEKAAARERLGGAALIADGLLAGVPRNLPPLTQATKLQNKAAAVGFDWPSLAPVMAKMREELAELDEAVSSGNEDAVRDEFGDLLFVIANVARHLKLDPEVALGQTNAKFRRRFARIEELLREQDRLPENATLEEMDALWDRAKLEERGESNEP